MFRKCRRDLVAATFLAVAIPVLAAGPSGTGAFRLLGDFASPASDSAQFAKNYWGKSFGNRSVECPGCMAVPSAIADEQTRGFARLSFTLAPTAPEGRTYYANAGLMLPLDRAWTTANDIRGLTKVWFKARSSVANLTVKVNFDSPAFPFGSAGYVRQFNIAVGTEWKWYSILPSQFKYATWMLSDVKVAGKKVWVVRTNPDGSTFSEQVPLTADAVAGVLANKADSGASPSYSSDAVNALKNAKLIQFGIEPKYDASATPAGTALDPDFAAEATDATLDIDSVYLEGVEDLPWEDGVGCVGSRADTIEDFSRAKAEPGRNLLGGYWYAVSDTSSDPAKLADSAVGRSAIESDAEAGWAVDPLGGSANLVAVLDKGDAKAHPYSGFAQVGTELTKLESGIDLGGAKAISFKILAGGPDPDRPVFDVEKIKGVAFRIARASVGDSAVYGVTIPYRAINASLTGEPANVCVDLGRLRQPGWYEQKYGAKPFASQDATKLIWDLSIQDPAAASAARSQIQIFDVLVWGGKGVGVGEGIGRVRKPGSLSARAENGKVRISYMVPGREARIEVRDLSGRRILSISAPSSAAELELPISSGNGLVLVSILGEGVRLNHPVRAF